MAATGTTTIDFGAFPGTHDASVNITGQASIVAGSLVEAWIRPVATADHSADEHMLETIKVIAGNIQAGTGFTIYAFNTNQIAEPADTSEMYLGRFSGAGANPGRGRQDLQADRSMGGIAPRIYGQFTVAWVWN